MKRIHHARLPFVTTLILILLLLCLVPSLTLGEGSEYTITWEGIIKAYSGAGGEITVPQAVGEVPVRSVTHGVFSDREDITALHLSAPLSVLETGAMQNMSNLSELILPDTLRILGRNNVSFLSSLTSAIVPESVVYIASFCFYHCDSLQSVTFLGAPPVMEDNCFTFLPDDFVCYVPDDLLEAYRDLLPKEVSVQGSGRSAVAVSYTTPEEAFTFDAQTGTVVRYKGMDPYVVVPETIEGVRVREIGDGAFRSNIYVYRVDLPDGVERIGESAFEQMNCLSSIYLPDTVKIIDNRAFYGIFQGSHFHWPAHLEIIGENAFYNTYITDPVVMPASLRSIGAEAFRNSFISKVYLEGTIETIGDHAFEKSHLSYMQLNAYAFIPGISSTAFEGAASFQDLDLPWDTTQEVQYAFRDLLSEQAPSCYVWINNPTDCDYPEGDYLIEKGEDGLCYLTRFQSDQASLLLWHTCQLGNEYVPIVGLGDSVFEGNRTLKKFRVPHSDLFTTIGSRAFADSAISMIDLYYTTQSIGDHAFTNCLDLTELTLPASVTFLGEGALEGCEHLTRLTVLCDSALLTEDVIRGCTGLMGNPDGVVLSASASDAEVERISSLLQLTWPNKVLRAGEEREALLSMPQTPTDASLFEVDESGVLTAYKGRTVDVVVPREVDGITVRSIGYHAFDACRDYTDTGMLTNQLSPVPLRTVILPETVTSLEDSAFAFCQSLETFICYGALATTGKGTFRQCTDLRTVLFMNGVNVLDNYVFENTPSLETVYLPNAPACLGTQAFSASGIASFAVRAGVVGNRAFSACPNLTELHLTADIESLDGALADDCPSLSLLCYETEDLSFASRDGILAHPAPSLTVRIPSGLNEENLKKAQRPVLWGSECVVTVTEEACPRLSEEPLDPDSLSASILADAEAHPAVVTLSEPLPEAIPDTEPPAAQTAGEDRTPFLGTWQAVALMLDDTRYAAKDFGIQISLTFLDDGNCISTDADGEEDISTWSLQDGHVAVASIGILTLQTDGTLIASQDNMQVVFEKSTPEPEAEAEPVGAAEEVFSCLGTWEAVSIQSGDASYAAADFGLSMTLTFSENGTCLAVDGDGEETTLLWSCRDGVILLDDEIMTPQSDGTLTVSSGGLLLVFAPAAGTVEAIGSAVSSPDSLTAYIGVWHGVYLESGPMHGDPRALWNLMITLTLREDGTGTLDYGGSDEDCTWGWDEGQARVCIDEFPLTLTDEGFLLYNQEGSGQIFFSQDPDAVWPGGEDPSAKTEEPEQTPASSDVSAAPATGVLMDVKYLVTGADASGYWLDASMLGGEYSIVFHADMTADFVMVGVEIPPLPYRIDGDDLVMAYYGAGDLRFTPVEEGLMLDYFGSMNMLFVPAP